MVHEWHMDGSQMVRGGYLLPGSMNPVASNATRLLIPVTWYRCQAPCTYQVSGIRCQVPGNWHLAWYMVPGTWYQVAVAWYLVPGSCFRHLVPSAIYQVPGTRRLASWYHALGTRCLAPGTCYEWYADSTQNSYHFLQIMSVGINLRHE